jgi:hypothetical protein
MPPTELPTTAIERLLRSGDAAGALRIADELIKQSRRSFPGWLSRGCANMNLGRLADADVDIDTALKLSPTDPQASLLRGMIDQRLGRIDNAIKHLRRVSASSAPQSIEASNALAEVLWFAHRRDELAAFVAAGGAWLRDPRAALMIARVRASHDIDGAITDLQSIAARERSPILRRVAGFEAVGLLDKTARYREAFDLSVKLHADTTPPFDLEGMLAPVRQQHAQLASASVWPAPRVEAITGLAMVVGLPRSGTTLLEQMLDAHPSISGIGEYDGVEMLANDLVSTGRWPRAASSIARDDLLAMQSRYMSGARRLTREGATISFDKTLRAWRWLPAIAAVLPGTVCFQVARDPRDSAISTFLSYFHPINDGWTASLTSLRRVIEAERSILPSMLQSVGLAHECIVYEDLVKDPTGHATRCLNRLGLAMDARVLAPEANTRAVFTLSHEQVRRPINRTSIGRWKNYEFAFDSSWDALACAHDERRVIR